MMKKLHKQMYVVSSTHKNIRVSGYKRYLKRLSRVPEGRVLRPELRPKEKQKTSKAGCH